MFLSVSTKQETRRMTDEIRSVSIREAAENLGVSERHIARLIARKVLPSFMLGRRRLIRLTALQAFLEGQETEAR
jgi:excisionase family DNA binding protein